MADIGKPEKEVIAEPVEAPWAAPAPAEPATPVAPAEPEKVPA